jgi:hypothetical protein
MINDIQLYRHAKKIADETYDKPSAYKSGFIVKKYKELGGTYDGEKTKKGLDRWFKENWSDIGNNEYPVYRPTKRISLETPLTASEIDPIQARQQIALKQIIKGYSNLPPFIKGNGIEEYSNPDIVKRNAKRYFNKSVDIYLSNRKGKKYMILNPNTQHMVHFGAYGMEDYTKHKNKIRRQNYLKRATHIKGDWQNNKYSPNNLSINLLWN